MQLTHMVRDITVPNLSLPLQGLLAHQSCADPSHGSIWGFMAGTGGPWQCGWQGWHPSCPRDFLILIQETLWMRNNSRRPGSSLQMGGRPPSLPRALLQCAPDGLKSSAFLCLLPGARRRVTHPSPSAGKQIQEGLWSQADCGPVTASPHTSFY